MAFFATAHERSDQRSGAATKLARAMMTHPELVAGEGRACTLLMRAMDHKIAIKTGAEGVFTAIIPEKKMGVALKIVDGATRASNAAIAAILVRLGVLNPEHPATKAHMFAPLPNRRGINAARLQPTAALF